MSSPLKLSHSKVDMLARCGEQYRFRYIDGLRQPPSVASAVGNAIDHAVASEFAARARRSTLPREEIAEKAAGVVRAAWPNVKTHAEDAEQTQGEAIDRAVRMSLAYHAKQARFVPVDHVARWFSLRLDDATGDELNGRIDVDTLDGGVVDVKSRASGMKPNPSEAHASDQLTGYALARRILDTPTPETVPVALHVIVDRPKGGKLDGVAADDPAGVNVFAMNSHRTAEHMAAYLDRVHRAREVIRAGAFMPARLGEVLCSERFCGFWNLCKFSRRPVVVALPGPATDHNHGGPHHEE